MSDPSRQRLIRAVRLLPGAVRIGRGTIEEIAGTAGEADASAHTGAQGGEKSALASAQAEIQKLKFELRARESELGEARASAQNLKSQIEANRAEVEREKADFYEKARAEAARAAAEAEATGREEGLSKGHEEGLKKAEAEVSADYRNRFSEALALLGNIGASLADARDALAASHAPQLIRMWEMMLRKMLQVGVELDPAVVERQISYILSRVSDRERIVVCLNPSDVEMVENIKESMKDTIRGVKTFELHADERVDKGSCLVETALGIYDARWRTQLEQISAEVHDLLMEAMSADGAGN